MYHDVTAQPFLAEESPASPARGGKRVFKGAMGEQRGESAESDPNVPGDLSYLSRQMQAGRP